MGLTELLQRINEDKAFAERYADLAPDAFLERSRQDGYTVTTEEAARFSAVIGRPDGQLGDAELAAVAGGANVNPGNFPSMEDVLAELRNAGEAMKAQNEAMRHGSRDAAMMESLAAAERIQQSAADQLVLGQLSAAATGGPSAFRNAVNQLRQDGLWEQISPSLRQKLEGRL